VSIGTGASAAKKQLNSTGSLRRDKRWKLALVGLVGAYALLASYDLITNLSQLGLGATAPASSAPRKAAPATGGAPQSARPSGMPTPTPTASAAGQPAPGPLDVVSIASFGPDGFSDGDNPGIADRIIDVRTDQPWYSQWYASPHFGGLRSGTGLLLDLGATETVADVGLTLGSAPGADVQVRVGSTPSVNLPTVASASDAGGTIRLTTNPAKGRYVLIWFTRLPSVGQGRYQVNVYNVSVDGTARP
jgi:hypothetical protein